MSVGCGRARLAGCVALRDGTRVVARRREPTTMRSPVKPVEVHRTIEGPQDAPVLVLSGSVGSTLDMWQPQRHALSDEYRVLSYDHRGHGKSPVPAGPATIAHL